MRLTHYLFLTTILLQFTGSIAQKVSIPVIDFRNSIHPQLYKQGCSTIACHGNTYNNFKLSMFSASPMEDYESLYKSSGGRYCNIFEPNKSLIIRTLKGYNKSIPNHYKANTAFLEQIERWLNAGAPYESSKSIKLKKITLNIAKSSKIAKGSTVELVTLAYYDNNTIDTITSFCTYESLNKQLIAINRNLATPLQYGEANIVARYMHQFASIKISIPQPQLSYIPDGKSKIDQFVINKLKKLNIPPSEVCSDEVFIRRLYLDITGRIPTPEQTRTFLNNTADYKRDEIINELLYSEAFADYQTLKWGDLLRVKSEFPSNLWPNAVQAYNKWIKTSIVNNKPYNLFAQELILSTGSNFREPTVNFYRAYQKREPKLIGETAGLIFMGMRFECARCHAHPQTSITERHANDMSLFFNQLEYKKTAEWKEEIVYVNLDKHQANSITMVNGDRLSLDQYQDSRAAFAEWLTSKNNPYFAKVICNRIWYWLMGKGIVHEPDDFRITNPPSNPELLDYLTSELIKNDFDLKHIFALILKSETYQRSSVSSSLNINDETFFSHRLLKRLEAEQLIDAICDITGVPEKYMSKVPEPFTFLPKNHRAVLLEDGTISTPFLEMFGRPSRDISNENDRNNQLNMKQTLHLLNSDHLLNKIRQSQKIANLQRTAQNKEELIDELYLLILNRFASTNEKKIALSYMDQTQQKEKIEDFIWALINSSEFIFNH
ncbi:DUF1553 domain-containing protein [Labilibacter sediminis]|nr:DUF1553 domain-containing protein [Labilibacter sediminis]